MKLAADIAQDYLDTLPEYAGLEESFLSVFTGLVQRTRIEDRPPDLVLQFLIGAANGMRAVHYDTPLKAVLMHELADVIDKYVENIINQ